MIFLFHIYQIYSKLGLVTTEIEEASNSIKSSGFYMFAHLLETSRKLLGHIKESLHKIDIFVMIIEDEQC